MNKIVYPDSWNVNLDKFCSQQSSGKNQNSMQINVKGNMPDESSKK